MLYEILIASFIGSILALLAGALLLIREKIAKKFSLVLVSFAAGSLLGAAFFDLIPEAIEEGGGDPERIFIFTLVGILVFFLFEKYIRWFHCHHGEVCEDHTFASTILLGDTIHNFIDGIVIALSFALGTPVGVVTTIAVFLHEIPQEIGDFGVLLHLGWERKKILLFNLLTALATFVGAIIAFFALPFIEGFLPELIGFAAGNFLYIAISDLMPEIKRRAEPKNFFYFFVLLLGIFSIIFFGNIAGH